MGSNDDLDGYVTEVDYPPQLITQITPAWITAIARWHGVAAPDLRSGFRMLDVGCGTALGLSLMAASHPEASFEGIDGMASHITAGKAFSEGITNITLRHATFDTALRDARADCDIVAAHGVLSWVDAGPRQSAIELATARLKPGGLLVVSYNTLPGCAKQLAFQHLINTLTGAMSGRASDRYERAFAEVQEMADLGFEAISKPHLKRLSELAEQAPADYFVHEYMHDGWTPLWPRDVKRALAERGLRYIGQADFLRHRLDLCVPARQRTAIERAAPEHRDMLIDMANDTPFRIDLYARDPGAAPVDMLRRQVWIGAEVDAYTDLTTETPSGEVDFDEDAAHEILEALEGGPLSVGRLIDDLDYTLDVLIDSIECLLMGDRVMPLAPPASRVSLGAANDLNRRICAAAADTGDVPISALAGACGPVRVPVVQMGALPLDIETMLDRARRDEKFRARVLQPNIDIDSEAVRRRVARGLDEVHAKYARLGLTLW